MWLYMNKEQTTQVNMTDNMYWLYMDNEETTQVNMIGFHW